MQQNKTMKRFKIKETDRKGCRSDTYVGGTAYIDIQTLLMI